MSLRFFAMTAVAAAKNVLFILAQLLRRLGNLALLVQWNLFSVV